MLVYCYYKDLPMAVIEYRNGVWSVVRNRFPNKYSQDWRYNWFYHENLTSEFIEEVLEERRIDLARPNRKELLPRGVFGLIPELRVTHAMAYGDPYWVSFDEDCPNKFWDLHPRAEDFR